MSRNSSKLLGQVGVKICVTNARIDRVAVTGIDAPVTGQPLDMTAECSTPGIASATVEWYNSTDGVDVASGAVAQGGKYIWQALGKQDAKASGFTDVDAKAGYAKAVDWAVANGVTNGAGGGKFSPNTVCTRGHIVTFLHRAYVPEARV